MNDELIVKPLRPSGGGWIQLPLDIPEGAFEDARPYAIERWYHRSNELMALSAIEVVNPEGDLEPRPEYHISVSGVALGAYSNYRCSDSRAKWALRQFGLEGWFEDNHVPGGKVRNYWRPVAEPQVGQTCICIDEEPAMREMKGDYIWRGAPK